MKTSSSATYLIASIVIAGALAAGFATGPAFAQQASFKTDQFKFAFAYQPAELASADTAEKLLQRLQREVSVHCIGGARKMTLDERSRVAKCTNETMRESIGKFGSATLAQAYGRSDG
jgi:UrcA family protein